MCCNLKFTLDGAGTLLSDVLLSQIYNDRCKDFILLSNVLQSQIYSRRDRDLLNAVLLTQIGSEAYKGFWSVTHHRL